MDDERPTSADLLEAWRDAARATELADRLARTALAVAGDADVDADTAERVAKMAESAANSASLLAATAREAATVARSRAADRRTESEDAERTSQEAHSDETAALRRYADDSGNGHVDGSARSVFAEPLE